METKTISGVTNNESVFRSGDGTCFKTDLTTEVDFLIASQTIKPLH